ncbi:tyrosine-type recombinase/integrase [Lamprobacter modestohalophilus]|uniref:tyrosine-type recombinase/integrase n=1 Tax=Lamprobacter modestohalophilus TaxID=1064514 RepID=UPI002ADEF158|nr:tyrosine-type recombinase/integrase [Lamprobacter modestohalophilus]MEA1053014.1 tyrosine-type recombinase/integrase [Lamprobacter modestohalophilus]
MPKLNLTQHFVEQQARCPPEKGRIDYYDNKVVGFSLKVLPSGHKSFYLRYRDSHSKLIERKLASAATLTLSEARRIAQEILAKVTMGEDPFEQRRALRNVPTLAEFTASAYLPHVKGYKRSWQTDEGLLRNHVLPQLGKLYLDEIKRQHLVEIFSLHREHHEPASTNRVIILCRYVFNCALKWEVEGLSRNPTAGIDLYPENNKRERYLKKDEARRLFEALEASPNPLLSYIIAMLLLTGARKREVLDAQWADLDREQQRWRIERNKSGKTRHVPLSQGMLSLLAKLPRAAGNPYLFPNPKSGKPFVSIFNSWNTARCLAGLSDLRIHDLRHSFASYVINQGRSLYEVQQLLGHTQVKTTQRYAHLSQESLLSAADTAARSVPWDREARALGETETETAQDQEAIKALEREGDSGSGKQPGCAPGMKAKQGTGTPPAPVQSPPGDDAPSSDPEDE